MMRQSRRTRPERRSQIEVAHEVAEVVVVLGDEEALGVDEVEGAAEDSKQLERNGI